MPSAAVSAASSELALLVRQLDELSGSSSSSSSSYSHKDGEGHYSQGSKLLTGEEPEEDETKNEHGKKSDLFVSSQAKGSRRAGKFLGGTGLHNRGRRGRRRVYFSPSRQSEEERREKEATSCFSGLQIGSSEPPIWTADAAVRFFSRSCSRSREKKKRYDATSINTEGGTHEGTYSSAADLKLVRRAAAAAFERCLPVSTELSPCLAPYYSPVLHPFWLAQETPPLSSHVGGTQHDDDTRNGNTCDNVSECQPPLMTAANPTFTTINEGYISLDTSPSCRSKSTKQRRTRSLTRSNPLSVRRRRTQRRRDRSLREVLQQELPQQSPEAAAAAAAALLSCNSFNSYRIATVVPPAPGKGTWSDDTSLGDLLPVLLPEQYENERQEQQQLQRLLLPLQQQQRNAAEALFLWQQQQQQEQETLLSFPIGYGRNSSTDASAAAAAQQIHVAVGGASLFDASITEKKPEATCNKEEIEKTEEGMIKLPMSTEQLRALLQGDAKPPDDARGKSVGGSQSLCSNDGVYGDTSGDALQREYVYGEEKGNRITTTDAWERWMESSGCNLMSQSFVRASFAAAAATAQTEAERVAAQPLAETLQQRHMKVRLQQQQKQQQQQEKELDKQNADLVSKYTSSLLSSAYHSAARSDNKGEDTTVLCQSRVADVVERRDDESVVSEEFPFTSRTPVAATLAAKAAAIDAAAAAERNAASLSAAHDAVGRVKLQQVWGAAAAEKERRRLFQELKRQEEQQHILESDVKVIHGMQRELDTLQADLTERRDQLRQQMEKNADWANKETHLLQNDMLMQQLQQLERGKVTLRMQTHKQERQQQEEQQSQLLASQELSNQQPQDARIIMPFLDQLRSSSEKLFMRDSQHPPIITIEGGQQQLQPRQEKTVHSGTLPSISAASVSATPFAITRPAATDTHNILPVPGAYVTAATVPVPLIRVVPCNTNVVATKASSPVIADPSHARSAAADSLAGIGNLPADTTLAAPPIVAAAKVSPADHPAAGGEMTTDSAAATPAPAGGGAADRSDVNRSMVSSAAGIAAAPVASPVAADAAPSASSAVGMMAIAPAAARFIRSAAVIEKRDLRHHRTRSRSPVTRPSSPTTAAKKVTATAKAGATQSTPTEKTEGMTAAIDNAQLVTPTTRDMETKNSLTPSVGTAAIACPGSPRTVSSGLTQKHKQQQHKQQQQKERQQQQQQKEHQQQLKQVQPSKQQQLQQKPATKQQQQEPHSKQQQQPVQHSKQQQQDEQRNKTPVAAPSVLEAQMNVEKPSGKPAQVTVIKTETLEEIDVSATAADAGERESSPDSLPVFAADRPSALPSAADVPVSPTTSSPVAAAGSASLSEVAGVRPCERPTLRTVTITPSSSASTPVGIVGTDSATQEVLSTAASVAQGAVSSATAVAAADVGPISTPSTTPLSVRFKLNGVSMARQQQQQVDGADEQQLQHVKQQHLQLPLLQQQQHKSQQGVRQETEEQEQQQQRQLLPPTSQPQQQQQQQQRLHLHVCKEGNRYVLRQQAQQQQEESQVQLPTITISEGSRKTLSSNTRQQQMAFTTTSGGTRSSGIGTPSTSTVAGARGGGTSIAYNSTAAATYSDYTGSAGAKNMKIAQIHAPNSHSADAKMVTAAAMCKPHSRSAEAEGLTAAAMHNTHVHSTVAKKATVAAMHKAYSHPAEAEKATAPAVHKIHVHSADAKVTAGGIHKASSQPAEAGKAAAAAVYNTHSHSADAKMIKAGATCSAFSRAADVKQVPAATIRGHGTYSHSGDSKTATAAAIHDITCSPAADGPVIKQWRIVNGVATPILTAPYKATKFTYIRTPTGLDTAAGPRTIAANARGAPVAAVRGGAATATGGGGERGMICSPLPPHVVTYGAVREATLVAKKEPATAVAQKKTSFFERLRLLLGGSSCSSSSSRCTGNVCDSETASESSTAPAQRRNGQQRVSRGAAVDEMIVSPLWLVPQQQQQRQPSHHQEHMLWWPVQQQSHPSQQCTDTSLPKMQYPVQAFRTHIAATSDGIYTVPQMHAPVSATLVDSSQYPSSLRSSPHYSTSSPASCDAAYYSSSPDSHNMEPHAIQCKPQEQPQEHVQYYQFEPSTRHEKHSVCPQQQETCAVRASMIPAAGTTPTRLPAAAQTGLLISDHSTAYVQPPGSATPPVAAVRVCSPIKGSVVSQANEGERTYVVSHDGTHHASFPPATTSLSSPKATYEVLQRTSSMPQSRPTAAATYDDTGSSCNRGAEIAGSADPSGAVAALGCPCLTRGPFVTGEPPPPQRWRSGMVYTSPNDVLPNKCEHVSPMRFQTTGQSVRRRQDWSQESRSPHPPRTPSKASLYDREEQQQFLFQQKLQQLRREQGVYSRQAINELDQEARVRQGEKLQTMEKVSTRGGSHLRRIEAMEKDIHNNEYGESDAYPLDRYADAQSMGTPDYPSVLPRSTRYGEKESKNVGATEDTRAAEICALLRRRRTIDEGPINEYEEIQRTSAGGGGGRRKTGRKSKVPDNWIRFGAEAIATEEEDITNLAAAVASSEETTAAAAASSDEAPAAALRPTVIAATYNAVMGGGRDMSRRRNRCMVGFKREWLDGQRSDSSFSPDLDGQHRRRREQHGHHHQTSKQVTSENTPSFIPANDAIVVQRLLQQRRLLQQQRQRLLRRQQGERMTNDFTEDESPPPPAASSLSDKRGHEGIRSTGILSQQYEGQSIQQNQYTPTGVSVVKQQQQQQQRQLEQQQRQQQLEQQQQLQCQRRRKQYQGDLSQQHQGKYSEDQVQSQQQQDVGHHVSQKVTNDINSEQQPVSGLSVSAVAGPLRIQGAVEHDEDDAERASVRNHHQQKGVAVEETTRSQQRDGNTSKKSSSGSRRSSSRSRKSSIKRSDQGSRDSLDISQCRQGATEVASSSGASSSLRNAALSSEEGCSATAKPSKTEGDSVARVPLTPERTTPSATVPETSAATVPKSEVVTAEQCTKNMQQHSQGKRGGLREVNDTATAAAAAHIAAVAATKAARAADTAIAVLAAATVGTPLEIHTLPQRQQRDSSQALRNKHEADFSHVVPLTASNLLRNRNGIKVEEKEIQETTIPGLVSEIEKQLHVSTPYVLHTAVDKSTASKTLHQSDARQLPRSTFAGDRISSAIPGGVDTPIFGKEEKKNRKCLLDGVGSPNAAAVATAAAAAAAADAAQEAARRAAANIEEVAAAVAEPLRSVQQVFSSCTLGGSTVPPAPGTGETPSAWAAGTARGVPTPTYFYQSTYEDRKPLPLPSTVTIETQQQQPLVLRYWYAETPHRDQPLAHT